MEWHELYPKDKEPSMEEIAAALQDKCDTTKATPSDGCWLMLAARDAGGVDDMRILLDAKAAAL